MFNVSLASERRQRTLANEAVGTTSQLRWHPSHSLQKEGLGGEEIWEAAFVYVPNLIARVTVTLTHHLK